MDNLRDGTRIALRRLAKSVAVVTTRWQGERLAMAATAVEGLSLDPPSMLLCVNRDASLAAPLLARSPFAISLLGVQHGELPSRCSAPWRGEERFALGAWIDWDGVPVLEDSQAIFLCVPDAIHDYGTHHIVIGLIERVWSSLEAKPMIYVDGKFCGLPSGNV